MCIHFRISSHLHYSYIRNQIRRVVYRREGSKKGTGIICTDHGQNLKLRVCFHSIFSCSFQVRLGLARFKECPAGLVPPAMASNRRKGTVKIRKTPQLRIVPIIHLCCCNNVLMIVKHVRKWAHTKNDLLNLHGVSLSQMKRKILLFF